MSEGAVRDGSTIVTREDEAVGSQAEDTDMLDQCRHHLVGERDCPGCPGGESVSGKRLRDPENAPDGKVAVAVGVNSECIRRVGNGAGPLLAARHHEWPD
jgi:hypothetical protein